MHISKASVREAVDSLGIAAYPAVIEQVALGSARYRAYDIAFGLAGAVFDFYKSAFARGVGEQAVNRSFSGDFLAVDGKDNVAG